MRQHPARFRREKRGSGQGQQRAGNNIQQQHGSTAGAMPMLAHRGEIAKELVSGINACCTYGGKEQAGYIVHGHVLKQLDLQRPKVPESLGFFAVFIDGRLVVGG